VNLADGCGSHRAAFKAQVAFCQGSAQFGFGCPADIIIGFRLYFVLQACQFIGDFARQHIQPGGEKLSDFNHDPTHADGCFAEIAGNFNQPLRTIAPGKTPQANAGQENIPEDDRNQNAGKKPQDAAIATFEHGEIITPPIGRAQQHKTGMSVCTLGYTWRMLNIPPHAIRIGAVHLHASQPSTLAAFYQHTLGMDLLGSAGETLLLGVSGQPMLGIHPANQPPFSGRHTGLYHMALLYPSRLALARAYRRLVNFRTRLQGASDHGVSESIYLADPENNGIELYSDRKPNDWPRGPDGTLQMVTSTLDLEELLSEDNAATSRPHVDPRTCIGHIHLNVVNLKECERFYTDILGFEVTQRYSNSAVFVSTGGYHHHLALNTWQGTRAVQPPQGVPGLAWFEIYGAPISAIRHRLEASGWEIEEFPASGLFVRDPAGIGVLLMED
jgi:catechol 2,3-dioxygenase